MTDIMKTSPAVFAVGRDYIISIPLKSPCLAFVRVGDRCYYDHSNGILRSSTDIHKIKLPMDALDAEGKYTVCLRPMIARKPYFSECSDIIEKEYNFYPVSSDAPRLFHISDAHGMAEAPIGAYKCYEENIGEVDFFVLNGDIIDHSGKLEHFDTIYKIAEGITHGEKPIVFSRGNHDMRGIYAEKLEDYTPTDNGKSYYTFRLGTIWGMILDCAEDKCDSHGEYGNTICAHDFRREQTEFIKCVIENAGREYNAPNIKHRMIVSHIPFTMKFNPPFNIEEELYAEWVELIRSNIKPDLLLSGHEHKTAVFPAGCEKDAYDAKFPTLVASKPHRKDLAFDGAGIEFGTDAVNAVFCGNNGIIEKFII